MSQWPDLLDVGQRRAVELDVLDQLEQPLVDVQEGHVAAEAAGQRDGGHLAACAGACGITGSVHDAASACCDTGVASKRRSPIGIDEAAPLGQDHAHRADAGGAVGQRHVGVAQPAAVAVDQQVRADAVAADGKDVLAVDLAAGAHAQLAQDAAVEVEQDVGVAGVHRPVGIELLEVRAFHAHLVGGGLQQAVAALLAAGAEVVALDEQHLQQRLALRVQLRRCRSPPPARRAASTVQAAPARPLTLTVQMRHEPCGAKSGCQHRCGM